jgi:lysophospholipase L1-like esterase
MAMGAVLASWCAVASCSGDDSSTGVTTTAGSSTGAGGEATTTSTSSSATGGDGGATATGGDGGSGGQLLTVEECYADDFVVTMADGPDYDQFSPVVGSHCMGTNHQDIVGVERVVFLGDSITVGSPPTWPDDFYRSKLADALAAHFGLAPPGSLWKWYDALNGTTLVQDSGDFSSCAKWGARTDDLLQDNDQVLDCFPPDKRQLRTLVVMTMGGNDISSLTQDAIANLPEQELWQKTEQFVQLMREAVEWFYEPGRFPNGVFVIFGNMLEFTDGTGEVEACDVSGLAGFDQPVPYPDLLADMVIWANEQYVSIAVETGADVVFMLEDFCGHGFNNEDPTAPCYRGVGAERWFDLTCIHPNPSGHEHLKDMFLAVVEE